MVVDQKTYIDSVNRNVTHENQGIQDFVKPQEQTKSIFGGKFASYEKQAVSESGNIDMSQSTYHKPGKEDDSVAEKIQKTEGDFEKNHKNEMIVLSQTTTPESYEKIQEEGFSVTASDSATIITVTDKIKAVMAKAGVVYGDSLSKEQLEEITGSVAMAMQIENLSEAGQAYLIKNELDPTVENVYKAVYSSQSMQQFSISSQDFNAMKDQLQQVLTDAGLEANEKNLNTCKWLLSYQLPVTGDNIAYANDLSTLAEQLETDGLDEQVLLSNITNQYVNGENPTSAMLIEGYSLIDQAQETAMQLEAVSENGLRYCISTNQELTISNLYKASVQSDTKGDLPIADEKQAALATARRQLEEVRLAMTVEANHALLKKGIQIDTQPIEQLLGQLQDVENQYYQNLLSSSGVSDSKENVDLLKTTVSYMQDLKTSPAVVLGQITKASTLEEVHATAQTSKASFEKANQSYETLMTAPRKDMGDSIQKAFANVDDILRDLNLDTSEANRRAVRILSYNQMELSVDNINQVKTLDEQVQRAFKNMTPATTLEMIREGINPLEMSMPELNKTATEIKAASGIEEHDRFSKYLYKLDRKKEITKEERSSFVGIYRLMSQVEQSDGAVIGALMQQGADITMKNLLTAVRSGKKGSMEYTVDDNFDGVEGSVKGPKIDDQIMASYYNDCIKDAMDEVSSDKLTTISNWEQMTPEEFKEALLATPVSEEEALAQEEYVKEQLAQVQEVLDAPEEIYQYLDKYDVSNSVDNVLAAMRMLQNPNGMFDQLFPKNKSNLEKVQDLKEEVLERFGEALKTPQEMVEAQETLAELAENAMKTMIIENDDVSALDLKELQLLNNQFQLCSKKAQDESYMVPVATADGMCAVSVKVMRGKDTKGLVDIMFRGELMGKVAASFEAKENGISGMIAADDEQTAKLLSDNLGRMAQLLNENVDEGSKEAVDLRVAVIGDLSLENFEMKSLHRESEGSKDNLVQTKRLYHIAEGFVQSIQELFSDGLF